MAIRFVDVESVRDEGAKPAPARRVRAPEAGPGSPPETSEDAEPAGAPSGDEAPLPGLPHAKPEPKARGRKKPTAPLLDGLVPELQAHAKPTPKPRGRKKAFG